MAGSSQRPETPESRVPFGRPDAGHFLAQAIVCGVPAGVCAGIWAALGAAFLGLPWWSPLALYTTHMAGLSRRAVVAHSLVAAVIAGLVWLALLGMALGALWGLIAGVAAPRPASRRLMAGIGFIYGMLVFALVASTRTSLLPPPFARDLPEWVRAEALGVMGAVIGGWASEGQINH